MKQLQKIKDTKTVAKFNMTTGKFEYDIKHVAEILDSSDSEYEDDYEGKMQKLNR